MSRRCTSAADFGPYGLAATRGRRRAGRAGRRADSDRFAVRRGAGHLDEQSGEAVPGVHPVLPGLERARRPLPRLGRPTSPSRLAGGRAPGKTVDADPDLVPLAGEEVARRVALVAGPTPVGSPTMPTCTTTPAPTRPRTCRSRCAGDICTRGRCWRSGRAAARRAPRCSPDSWPGGTSSPMCCSTGRDAVTQPIRPEFCRMPTDEPRPDRDAAERLAAWQHGRTGYPLVDAGMRQLIAEGWMHNRVRMVVASFLIKDLHIGWWHGADWFMDHLRDGDIAQNQLNWQWVAGCGTDAAPYFRVFNPTTQAKKFDRRRDLHPAIRARARRRARTSTSTSRGVRLMVCPRATRSPSLITPTERKEALDRYDADQEVSGKVRPGQPASSRSNRVVSTATASRAGPRYGADRPVAGPAPGWRGPSG